MTSAEFERAILLFDLPLRPKITWEHTMADVLPGGLFFLILGDRLTVFRRQKPELLLGDLGRASTRAHGLSRSILPRTQSYAACAYTARGQQAACDRALYTNIKLNIADTESSHRLVMDPWCADLCERHRGCMRALSRTEKTHHGTTTHRTKQLTKIR